ncbi:nucleotide exchange factor GrpE [Natronolimnohabitans sp. A-GB9]|uniref:nucleotide exchange factor GrpE n=1 Tax=Natronolimnohabitans sp. A-GB9 TaxID=3069757 RepID=UPI0027B0A68F|nr:nucleotide exchange factor GrpE [Natronolimnohabitans sp. A-GB9]MDQ2051899.1 nucleotide exchange factor GrpE [Natronolimnohabitans sp. A-GB9]
MSEDEGTNAGAQGVPSEEHSDDGESADVESTAGANTDESDVDASETDTESEEPSAPETSEDVQELLDRITEYDDDLAHEVNAIVEEARDLNETVADQRAELEDLGERVEEQAETIEGLRSELEAREAEVDDLESRLKRKQADFQNYKKRAKKRQEQMKDRATEDLVERLLGVRDNMKRALEEESGDADSLREGVEMTLTEFDRVLEEENVSEIDPEPGAETDPQRHEVMMQVDSALPEGTIADVYTPGYEMGDKVIQNAQVTVSNGELEDDADDSEDADASTEDDETDD